MGKKKELKKKRKYHRKRAKEIGKELKAMKEKGSRIGFKWYD
jgi:hypothetical protein